MFQNADFKAIICGFEYQLHPFPGSLTLGNLDLVHHTFIT